MSSSRSAERLLRRTLVVSVLVWAAGVRAGLAEEEQTPSIAVAVSRPPLPAPRLAQVRAHLSERFRLLDDEEIRQWLESRPRPGTAREQVEERLERARAYLRRLDTSGVAAALGEAEELASRLTPDAAGRGLWLELFKRRAELARVEGIPGAAAAALALALSVEPGLTLDPAAHPPAEVALLSEVRGWLDRGHRVSRTLVTEPPGAEVVVSGEVAGRTPLRLSMPAELPILVWLTLEGHWPHALVLEPRGEGRRITVTLSPLSRADRVQGLVERLRRGEDRAAAARSLASELEVDGIAWAEESLDPVLLWLNPPTEPPRVTPVVAEPRQVAPAPVSFRLPRWLWVACATAAGAAVASGVGLGLTSRARSEEATRASFASEAEAKTRAAQASARQANVAYGVGGGMAAVGLLFYFVL